MRILIINELLTLGGAQCISVEIANAMAEHKDLEIFFTSSGGALTERLNSKITFFEIPLYNPFLIPLLIIKLAHIIKTVKPDNTDYRKENI